MKFVALRRRRSLNMVHFTQHVFQLLITSLLPARQSQCGIQVQVAKNQGLIGDKTAGLLCTHRYRCLITKTCQTPTLVQACTYLLAAQVPSHIPTNV